MFNIHIKDPNPYLCIQCLTIGHVHEDPFPGLVNAELLTFLIDVSNHGMGMVLSLIHI